MPDLSLEDLPLPDLSLVELSLEELSLEELSLEELSLELEECFFDFLEFVVRFFVDFFGFLPPVEMIFLPFYRCPS